MNSLCFTASAPTREFVFSKPPNELPTPQQQEANLSLKFPDWLARVSPGWDWEARHLAHIQERLSQVTAGTLRRLMLFLPPRHGKSEQTTIRYPIWRMERDLTTRVCVGAYNQRFAERFGRRARRMAERRFAIAADRRAAMEWETMEGGVYRSCGVGSPPTGEGFDLVVIDDPVQSREEAESLAYRDRLWDWYRDDLYTRLEPRASIILIMTRWHHDDLAGRLLGEMDQGGERWEVVNLPALAEDNDALGRAEGEPLWQERFGVEDFERIRLVQGSYSFSALYQGRPTPREGALFKRDWFRIEERAPSDLRWVRYWDLAASTKTSADYTCSAAVGLGTDGTLYIRDMIRGRWEWPDARGIIIQTMLMEPTARHYVEEALHGLAALQELRRMPQVAHIAFGGVVVEKDKLTRAFPWATRAEAGKVALVRGHWNSAFLDEVCQFPEGAHDDQVDTVSGGVALLAISEPAQGEYIPPGDEYFAGDRSIDPWGRDDGT